MERQVEAISSQIKALAIVALRRSPSGLFEQFAEASCEGGVDLLLQCQIALDAFSSDLVEQQLVAFMGLSLGADVAAGGSRAASHWPSRWCAELSRAARAL